MPYLGDIGHIVPAGEGVPTPRGWWNFSGAAETSFLSDWFVRDDSDGMPTPPCIRQLRKGILRPPVISPWPVNGPGFCTLHIWCSHSGHSPPPRVVVRANPEIGVNTDIEAVVADSTGWQEIIVVVTPNAKGALEVWLEVRAEEMSAWAKWDNMWIE